MLDKQNINLYIRTYTTLADFVYSVQGVAMDEIQSEEIRKSAKALEEGTNEDVASVHTNSPHEVEQVAERVAAEKPRTHIVPIRLKPQTPKKLWR